ncbi:DUF4062 domain-containing protein [Actinomadura macrotermitis]|uniref:DUF4062 domain-containing protein n=1 Tax=Actinomadura macrotermitis TaxID=2585200 RepID=A0A7K0C485_9ACTN|nr:DUF4062 domain-containing protein [Actinomadura macrotermitis]MQY08260.1 hypothetical protein [Actinomadura macrotermitis]
MVAKRYQVFISSTRRDLGDERRAVAEALLEHGFIPIGMEQFPASGQAGWPLIERFIDECDYYVLIVGRLYGSQRPNGVSYVESEYDYAVATGKPVLAFLLDEEDVADKRVALFRAKIGQDRLRSAWRTPDELAREIVAALHKEIVDNPRPGWVRGDSLPAALDERVAALLDPCERLGIARIGEDGIAGPQLTEGIRNARVVRVMSTSAVRLFEIHKDAFAHMLGRGGDLRLLTPEPDGVFLRDVEVSESGGIDRGATIGDEIRVVRARLLETMADARRAAGGELHGTVSMGHFRSHLRSTLVLCDHAWGRLTITLPPARASETASLELRGGASRPLLTTCVRHFDRTWEIAEARGDVTALRAPGA